MPERPKFYLTTAIAYPNNRPGLHTLYEVIGADVIARWHRMLGHETRFLTGTDEHSVNIHQRAQELGRDTREFVDAMVELYREAEDAMLIAPDRFIRTTDPDHRRASQEMVRRAYGNGDIYQGTYEGWYCPNEGFRAASDLEQGADGHTRCPNHPGVELQWLKERNWFFRLSAYQERLEQLYAERPEWVEPEFRRNEMLAFIRQGLDDISISRETFRWGIPFPIREDGSAAVLEDGSPDPSAGVIYVWFDALINYITGAGFPDDMAAFERWWPADLHVIGKDINRFHTIIWPAMLMSAGIELPRKVWVHGWLLAQGERMSKSRGNFLDPLDSVRTFGPDGARYVSLREVPFDRDADVSWDSFIRRYNADLANDFGNLLNRTLSMTGRYLEGVRPRPRPAGDSVLASAWQEAWTVYARKLDSYLLHEALAALWSFVGEANRFVDSEQPWALAKAAKAGDDEAGDRLQASLGDLLEACRLIGLAAAPFMPGMAPRVAAQLGLAFPYATDGNSGPPLAELLQWAADGEGEGSIGRPEILFPRIDNEETGTAKE
ncbi:MAG TPA: methionine--tRNA ligase [Candidatus Limnocylindria bacterium]|nr:methionine--tRNA ligase [Candidatus Limnocylindria bacterium]